jgi:hypothetical protein
LSGVRSTLKNKKEAIIVKRAACLLIIFLLVLTGCSTNSKEVVSNPNKEVVKTTGTESEGPSTDKPGKEEVIKETDVNEKRFEEIKADLLERGLISKDTKVYRIGERAVISEDISCRNSEEEKLKGKEYFITGVCLRTEELLFEKEKKVFILRFVLIIDKIFDHALDYDIGVLVGNEVVNIKKNWNQTFKAEVDGEKAIRTRMESPAKSIVEEIEGSDRVVLFSRFMDQTDVFIVFKSEFS